MPEVGQAVGRGPYVARAGLALTSLRSALFIILVCSAGVPVGGWMT